MADFELTTTSFTIADYCQLLKKRKVTVNRDYQRSDRVWPPAAKSFLIETILLGYPMPKLSLYQVTDVKTRETTKEIVDGQQRSMTILQFFDGKLKLGRSIELKDLVGCSYEDLTEETQHQFLDYPLSVDLFTGAKPEEIREIFRRINSYTVPLNPEEHRHAVFQGEVKWFVYQLARTYEHVMLDIGVFRPKSIVRMADTKLYAELIHAFVNGIVTMKAAQLDELYKEKDKVFDEADKVANRLSAAIDVVLELPDLHGGPMMKPHMVYSLLLAIMHLQDPVPKLQNVYESEPVDNFDYATAASRLTELGDSLSLDPEETPIGDFVAASSSATNVKAKRETRFRWICDALLATQ